VARVNDASLTEKVHCYNLIYGWKVGCNEDAALSG